jgi:16S rRNA (uracil1498-N3)-methyltransferase
VNILILEDAEIGARIPRADRRWQHVKKILKKRPGDRIAAGLACGAREAAEGRVGEAILRELDDSGMVLDFEAFPGGAGLPPPLAPLRVLLGFPRPIQASRILKDLSSLGVAEILLAGTELGEKSYLQSSFFKDREFGRSMIEGAEQAGNPRLPEVRTYWTLARCLADLGERAGPRLYLHPYGGAERLGAAERLEAPVTLAIGSERGWTEAETSMLEEAGFSARGLGARVLKSETATLAAVVLALAALRSM